MIPFDYELYNNNISSLLFSSLRRSRPPNSLSSWAVRQRRQKQQGLFQISFLKIQRIMIKNLGLVLVAKDGGKLFYFCERSATSMTDCNPSFHLQATSHFSLLLVQSRCLSQQAFMQTGLTLMLCHKRSELFLVWNMVSDLPKRAAHPLPLHQVLGSPIVNPSVCDGCDNKVWNFFGRRLGEKKNQKDQHKKQKKFKY